jgi:hypothetical protein
MIAALLAAALLAAAPEAVPERGGVAALRAMPAAYARLSAYRCLFVRQERLAGALLPEERIRLRFRKPFAVRLDWVGKTHRGRRAVYVEGMDGKIRAREGGVRGLFTVKLDPRGKRAMSGNRHPITEVGLGHAIELITSELERSLARREGEIEAGEDPDEPGALRVEMRLEGAERYAPRMVVWVDRGLGLPVRVEVEDPAGTLLERYEYRELELDPGLGPDDFRP